MRARSNEPINRQRARLGRGLAMALVVFLGSLCCTLISGSSSFAQTSGYDTTNWRAYRTSLEQQFGAELQEIANWCRANGIPQQVKETF